MITSLLLLQAAKLETITCDLTHRTADCMPSATGLMTLYHRLAQSSSIKLSGSLQHKAMTTAPQNLEAQLKHIGNKIQSMRADVEKINACIQQAILALRQTYNGGMHIQQAWRAKEKAQQSSQARLDVERAHYSGSAQIFNAAADDWQLIIAQYDIGKHHIAQRQREANVKLARNHQDIVALLDNDAGLDARWRDTKQIVDGLQIRSSIILHDKPDIGTARKIRRALPVITDDGQPDALQLGFAFRYVFGAMEDAQLAALVKRSKVSEEEAASYVQGNYRAYAARKRHKAGFQAFEDNPAKRAQQRAEGIVFDGVALDEAIRQESGLQSLFNEILETPENELNIEDAIRRLQALVLIYYNHYDINREIVSGWIVDAIDQNKRTIEALKARQAQAETAQERFLLEEQANQEIAKRIIGTVLNDAAAEWDADEIAADIATYEGKVEASTATITTLQTAVNALPRGDATRKGLEKSISEERGKLRIAQRTLAELKIRQQQREKWHEALIPVTYRHFIAKAQEDSDQYTQQEYKVAQALIADTNWAHAITSQEKLQCVFSVRKARALSEVTRAETEMVGRKERAEALWGQIEAKKTDLFYSIQNDGLNHRTTQTYAKQLLSLIAAGNQTTLDNVGAGGYYYNIATPVPKAVSDVYQAPWIKESDAIAGREHMQRQSRILIPCLVYAMHVLGGNVTMQLRNLHEGIAGDKTHLGWINLICNAYQRPALDTIPMGEEFFRDEELDHKVKRYEGTVQRLTGLQNYGEYFDAAYAELQIADYKRRQKIAEGERQMTENRRKITEHLVFRGLTTYINEHWDIVEVHYRRQQQGYHYIVNPNKDRVLEDIKSKFEPYIRLYVFREAILDKVNQLNADDRLRAPDVLCNAQGMQGAFHFSDIESGIRGHDVLQSPPATWEPTIVGMQRQQRWVGALQNWQRTLTDNNYQRLSGEFVQFVRNQFGVNIYHGDEQRMIREGLGYFTDFYTLWIKAFVYAQRHNKMPEMIYNLSQFHQCLQGNYTNLAEWLIEKGWDVHGDAVNIDAYL